MIRKFRFDILAVGFATLMLSLGAGCGRMFCSSGGKGEQRVTRPPEEVSTMGEVRFEHVALNVEDPVQMAEWYRRNLRMKVVRTGPAPANTRFISDAAGNMMLELYHNPPDAVPDYASMDPLLLHIAFMADDVEGIRERLIVAGATAVGDVSITPAGDKIAVLRDPWGVAIQFVERAEPMLSD